MSKIITLASSSSGNCTYVSHGQSGILVDAGISAKAMTEALCAHNIDANTIKAIFVTHEHIDHVSGLRVFSKKYNIPIYASQKTAESLLAKDTLDTDKNLYIIDGTTQIEELLVTRFNTSHDCEGSSGYTFTLPNGKKCAVCTDLGFVSDEVRQNLLGCTALVFESNHDVTMLQKGTYPEHLKKRILSDKGHLSNVLCAKELDTLVKNGATRIILGHLSRENNRPEIARTTAVSSLLDHKLIENKDYLLYIAPVKCGNAVLF